jgi:hypothetical protein
MKDQLQEIVICFLIILSLVHLIELLLSLPKAQLCCTEWFQCRHLIVEEIVELKLLTKASSSCLQKRAQAAYKSELKLLTTIYRLFLADDFLDILQIIIIIICNYLAQLAYIDDVSQLRWQFQNFYNVELEHSLIPVDTSLPVSC